MASCIGNTGGLQAGAAGQLAARSAEVRFHAERSAPARSASVRVPPGVAPVTAASRASVSAPAVGVKEKRKEKDVAKQDERQLEQPADRIAPVQQRAKKTRVPMAPLREISPLSSIVSINGVSVRDCRIYNDSPEPADDYHGYLKETKKRESLKQAHTALGYGPGMARGGAKVVDNAGRPLVVLPATPKKDEKKKRFWKR